MKKAKIHITPDILTNDIIYSEDILETMSNHHLDACLHLVCTLGSVTFTIGGKDYTAHAYDCIIKPGGNSITKIRSTDNFQMKGIIISNHFLRKCIQDESYKTHGLLSMLDNPIMPMTEKETERILADIHEIKMRFLESYHTFYLQVLVKSVETMILDLQDIHSRINPKDLKGVSRPAKILRDFIGYLQTGLYRRERKVDYYAALLFITPKYLSEACIKASGHSASFWIDRFTSEEVARLLKDTSLSFTEISDQLHFSSMNYFTRYVHRTLAMNPSEYRAKILGKK